MKLNNNGWGYRDMIIYSSIIIIALVVVAVSISSFYDSLDIPYDSTVHSSSNNNENIEHGDNDALSDELVNNNNYFLQKEDELKNATLDYLNRYSYDMKDEILTISLETLISFDFIEPIYDYNSSTTCSGYSNVFITAQGNYEVKPFINCSNYVTAGY